MSRFPTIEETIAWLKDRDQPAMAHAVMLLQQNHDIAQRAVQVLRDNLASLRAQISPVYRYPDYRSPPDADG